MPTTCIALLALASGPQDAHVAATARPEVALEQQTAPGEPGFLRFRSELFAIDVPADWRRMSVDEVVKLRDSLPYDLRTVQPGGYEVVGAIDGWLAGRFDGRALVVVTQRFEQTVDAEFLDQVRAHWTSFRDPEAGTREVVDSRLIALGESGHPAAVCRIVTTPPAPARRHETLEYYASTSGQRLILGLRSWQDEFEAVLPMFERMGTSLTFARPPQEPDQLGDHLLRAAFAGAIVGLLLLAIRRRRAT